MKRTKPQLIVILFFLLIEGVCITIQGQRLNSIPKNSVYYELGGIGFSFYSINYERLIANGEVVSFELGCGLSLLMNQGTQNVVGFNDNQLRIPIQANLLFGRREHKFEFGYGMPIGIRKPKFELEAGFYVLRLGYRYQSSTNGVFFRASINPSLVGIGIPYPMVGLGIGYTF